MIRTFVLFLNADSEGVGSAQPGACSIGATGERLAGPVAAAQEP
jgi:hypothetical protein